MAQNWPIALYKRSVLKQRKLREIIALLGPTDGCCCLDVGGDNGVISALLRQRGGEWASADLDERTVQAIARLVGERVYQINGRTTPFPDDTFDRVVIVDFLEHIDEDRAFIVELHRIMKPGGQLIVNVPHAKDNWLRRLRYALGDTDEAHGHVRPGYTSESLAALLDGCFTVEVCRTYSKAFSELIDTAIRFGVARVKGRGGDGRKGQVVTGDDLGANRALFRLYSLVYPVVWLFAQLDRLLFFTSGYKLIARATVNK